MPYLLRNFKNLHVLIRHRVLRTRDSDSCDQIYRQREIAKALCFSELCLCTTSTMQGPGHPLQGVGYSDPTSRFDQLSRAASSLDFLPHHMPIASTSSTRHRPASSNGDQGPSPPDGSVRPTKKSRKSSSGPAGSGNQEEEGPSKKKAKQTLSCSECKVCSSLWIHE